jgi:hypothetical protein
VAVLELVLFPRLVRRLVVPAVVLVEPVLDLAGDGGDPVVVQERLDDGAGALGLGARAGVNEDLVPVVGDGELALLELAGELRGLAAELEAEPIEQVRDAAFVLDLDADAVVVLGYAGILP